MHEFSVITSIMELVQNEMAKANAKRLLEVQLEVGELSFLSHEALQFGFKALTEKEPGMGSAALKIIQIQAQVACKGCGYDGPIMTSEAERNHTIVPIFQCPECSGPVDIMKGRECVVRNLRMEVD